MVSNTRGPAKWLEASVVWLLFVGIGAAAMWWALVGPGAVSYGDFVQDYVLARATADHADAYAPIADLARSYVSGQAAAAWSTSPHPTPHPPTVGVLLLPVAFVDYSTAFRVWTVVQLGALGYAVWATGRLLGYWLRLRWTVAFTSILVVWQPVLQNVELGQSMLVLLASTVGGWLCLRSGRPLIGGALIGLGLLLKPVTWPVVVLLISPRRLPALAAAAIVCASVLAVTIVFTSTGSVLRYALDVLPKVGGYYAADLGNISLWTIPTRVLDRVVTDQVPSLGGSNLTAIATPIVPAVILFVFLWRTRGAPTSFPTLLALSALVSPISWTFNLVLAMPALALLGQTFSRTTWPGQIPYKLATIAAGVLLLVPWGAWNALGPQFSIAPTLEVLVALVLLNGPSQHDIQENACVYSAT